MNNLTYRAELHIQPFGQCQAKLREYPDFIITGSDFTDMMDKVQRQLPEFLFIMSCNRRTFRPPIDYESSATLPPGVMPYYCNVKVNVAEGKTTRFDFHIYEDFGKKIDFIIEQHPYFRSRSHFLTWAALRAADSLILNFWEEYDEFTSGIFDRAAIEHRYGFDSLVPIDVPVMELCSKYLIERSLDVQ